MRRDPSTSRRRLHMPRPVGGRSRLGRAASPGEGGRRGGLSEDFKLSPRAAPARLGHFGQVALFESGEWHREGGVVDGLLIGKDGGLKVDFSEALAQPIHLRLSIG